MVPMALTPLYRRHCTLCSRCGPVHGQPRRGFRQLRTPASCDAISCKENASYSLLKREEADEPEFHSEVMTSPQPTHVWDVGEVIKQYSRSDMIEVGYIWKELGVRGEVAIRIRTCFQDMRVGLAGPR